MPNQPPPTGAPTPVQPVEFRFECPRCGQGIINPDSQKCVACGQRFASASEDKPNPLLMALGFFLPPVGIVLFLLLRPRVPEQAASAARGVIFSPILYLLVVPYLANSGFFTPLLQALSR